MMRIAKFILLWLTFTCAVPAMSEVCLSQGPVSPLRRTLLKIEMLAPAKNTNESAANCFLAQELVGVVDNMALHFGFKPTFTGEFVTALTSDLSRSFVRKVQERFSQRGSDMQLTQPLEKKAAIFSLIWQQALSEEKRTAFLDTLQVSYLVSVRVHLDRPDYGSEMARLMAGGPFFALGGAMMKDTASETLVASGYAQNFGQFENSPQPDPKATAWAKYNFGFERKKLYPEPQSYFLMMNPNPFGVLSPEINRNAEWQYYKDKEMNFMFELSGHDLVLLRYQGQEYMTLEGRPCVNTKDRNDFICELPITFSQLTIEDVYTKTKQ